MKFSTMASAGISVLKGRLGSIKAPLFVTLATNNSCNSHCNYCKIPTRRQDDMSTADILRLIDEMADAGVLRLGVWGGEPLLHPDIIPIMRHAKERGLYTTLDSNGYLLPEKREVLEYVDTMILSMDGPEEAHDANRGKGTWKKVRAAMDVVPPDKPLWTITVLTRHNIDKVDWILQDARERGYTPTFQVLHHSDNFGINDTLRPSAEEYRKCLHHLAEAKRRGERSGTSVGAFEHLAAWKDYTKNMSEEGGLGWKKCWGGKFFVNVDPNGDMYPCSLVIGSVPAPNFLKLGFLEAYRQITPPPCQSCLATCFSEYNLLFSLSPRTILSWVMAMATGKK